MGNPKGRTLDELIEAAMRLIADRETELYRLLKELRLDLHYGMRPK